MFESLQKTPPDENQCLRHRLWGGKAYGRPTSAVYKFIAHAPGGEMDVLCDAETLQSQ